MQITPLTKGEWETLVNNANDFKENKSSIKFTKIMGKMLLMESGKISC